MNNYIYGIMIIIFLALALTTAFVPEHYALPLEQKAQADETPAKVIYVERTPINNELLADMDEAKRKRIKFEIIQDEILSTRAKLNVRGYPEGDDRRIILEERLVALRAELATLKNEK